MTNTKLIFYWYIHNRDWHYLYDIHIKLLNEYKDRFSEQEFIIATDSDTKQEYIDAVIAKLKSIFPNAKFTFYENDKQLRESKYFYNEIATKLDQMDDRWYFFAHNKGVDSHYAPGVLCKMWVVGMYYMNLNYPEKILEDMNKPKTCVIGTYLLHGFKYWPWLTFGWHYSGTFWWFNPKRISSLIKEKNTSIPQKNDRYFTESCWGSCIPDDDLYRKPALGKYNAQWRNKFNWMDPADREKAMNFLN